MGAGEYVARASRDRRPIGHFGLAVRDYTHSTAPNRRYPDVITQRLVKAALARAAGPLRERRAREPRAALHGAGGRREQGRAPRAQVGGGAPPPATAIGERFDGVVTGASEKGTWVRIFAPPVEGKVVRGEEGLDVGDRVRVKLLATDVERGFIDFARG